MSGRRVVIAGGGLAGITAALDCAATGAEVTLVEVRRRLGGAAYSFERDGLELDNGQHVFLRCCVAYRGLLSRIGSDHLVSVQPRLEIPVLKPGAEPFLLRRSRLPAPLQLGASLARYPYLTSAQRLGAVRAALGLMRMRHTSAGRREERLDRMTLGEWLARRGQGPQALAALWDLIALPTLNLPASQASLALGAFVFQVGLLDTADAGDIGFHDATLADTIGRPALAALQRAGVDVRLGWRAERLARGDGGGFEIQGGPDGETLAGDALIVAVPHARAARLLEPLLGRRARRLALLGATPIVNLHVVYDRPVLDQRFAAGVGTPVQYIFDRSAAAGARSGHQYLAVSLSGAEREMGMSVEALRERYLPAIAELLPRARQAKVERFVATREHSATFRAAPGIPALRPGARTALGGLLLAGAWTNTGWPATLEGAVMSGHTAAAAALERIGARTEPTVATV